MRSAWLACALSMSAALVACGDDGKDANSNSSTVKVGEYGGDCVDGAKRCTDQYGAPLCPVNAGYPGDGLARPGAKSPRPGAGSSRTGAGTPQPGAGIR